MLPDDLPEDMPWFLARFGTDEQCREYLFKARWPDGFRCVSPAGTTTPTRSRPRSSTSVLLAASSTRSWPAPSSKQTKTGLGRWFLAIYLVLYRAHEVLTAGGSQGKLVSERSRPGSARSAFQAAQAASTTAS